MAERDGRKLRRQSGHLKNEWKGPAIEIRRARPDGIPCSAELLR
jgi:hypothetical protein